MRMKQVKTHVETFRILLAIGFGDAFVLDSLEDTRHVRYQSQRHARVAVRSQSHHFFRPEARK